MLWQELIKVALMGTERAQLSSSAKDQLRNLGIETTLSEPRMVLEGAAYLATMHKGGVQSRQWTRKLPEPAPLEATENTCSPEAIHCLQQILDNIYPAALNEFITLLQIHQRHLPAELLPELFDQCRQNPNLWQKLQPCIGPRGNWLLRQNPDWAHLIDQPQEAIWEIGTRIQRLALIRHLRQSHPLRALELLQDSWASEDVKNRSAFLPLLAIGLSESDESFLEFCLDDRRKEVRQQAALLLVQIPTSALLQRMYQRVIDLFEIHKQGKNTNLEVQLPDTLTEEMIRDGIDPRNQGFPGGVKASRLGQMVATIPPVYWEKYFEDTPEKVFPLFISSNWPELFFSALSLAAATHRDHRWMNLLLDFWLHHHHEVPWQNIDLESMFPAIPAQLFNKIAIQGLEMEDPLSNSTTPMSILLKQVSLPWENDLTYLFFRNLKNALLQNSGQYWGSWHTFNILQKVAYLIDPSIWPTLQKAFDKDPVWYKTGEEIPKFIRVLKFRDQMHKSLA